MQVMTFKEAMEKAKREYWEQLFALGKSRVELARIAGVNRSDLYIYAHKFGLPMKSPPTNAGNRGNATWQRLGA